MTIIISTFLLVILVTLAYIARTYNWLLKAKLEQDIKNLPTYRVLPYGTQTLQQRFMYTTMHDFERRPRPFYYTDPEHIVVRDGKHLERIKQDYSHKLAKALLENELVQVEHRRDLTNPDLNHVRMTVQVVDPKT